MATMKNRFFTAYHSDIKLTPLYQYTTMGFMINMLAKKLSKLPKDKAPNTNNNSMIDPEMDQLSYIERGALVPNTNQHSTFGKPSRNERIKDYVAIIDLDYEGYEKNYDTIILPFIPRELEYNCESSFIPIGPIGRNNPFYHYTGAEDRLEFEIDWCSLDWGRKDVITNCRRIEALSKSDGYRGNPHRVMVKWGENQMLFKDHEFLVIAAPYRMVQYNGGQITESGHIENTSLLPVQAYQRITLARITENNLSKLQIEHI